MTATDRVPVFDGQSTQEHGQIAAGAIRAINHLTRSDASLPYPSPVWRLLGSLETMAARLPQACQQIATRLTRMHQSGSIGIDPGSRFHTDPAGAVAEATHQLLTTAIPAAEQLTSALGAAASVIAYAHSTDPTVDDASVP